MNPKKLTVLIAFAMIALSANAQTSQNQTERSAVRRPSHSVEWNEIALKSPAEFLSTEEAIRIADNVLLYQKNNGGWQKNIGFHVELTQGRIDSLIARKGRLDETCIDNDATYQEMYFLAKVYNATKIQRFKDGFLKGLNYIFEAQYPNGGFPQFHPNRTRTVYSHRITFNDDAVVNMLTIFKGIVERDEVYASVVDDPKLIARAQDGLDRGLDVILKTQIRRNGVLTAWCAQYDPFTLQPMGARAHEPRSISGGEGPSIAIFLMSFDKPTPEMRQAIDAAVKYYESTKIPGIRWDRFVGENGLPDRRIVEDPSAPPMWARFADIETDKPLFAGRNGVIKNTLAELEQERRAGYGYYVNTPQRLLNLYQEYVEKHR
ncbi:MAG: pectate lyase [Bacteroidales bacterium]|nr:pectate lyase [Bacteroidales bacterium]